LTENNRNRSEIQVENKVLKLQM